MGITSIYTLTIFTSAFLLFLVQPMISKLLLPYLGGSPAVWNTAMLFFQALLLLGYAYAHVSCKWLGAKKQALLHIVVVGISLAWLPIAAKTDLGFVSSLYPIQWVMLSLFLSVGVPFFVLAANSPLLQYWLAHTGHKDAQNPYFLYSASNAGSLLALFCYPFLMEPMFTLSRQMTLWSVGFGLFAMLITACAVLLGKDYRQPASGDAGNAAAAELTWKRRLHWVLLAFCPSSLLLGVTTYITTDLASLPLFWVIPLALYLLTFIFAFARRPLLVDRALAAQVVLVPLTTLAILFDINSVTALLLLHLITFFVLVMGCHGTLARLKPDPRHLTEYFLWLSFGGMLGGVFNALLAPQLFKEPMEYPLIFILTLLLRPQLVPDTPRERGLDYGVPLLFMLFLLLVFHAVSPAQVENSRILDALMNSLLPAALYVPMAAMAVMTYKRPLRFALLILAVFLAVPVGKGFGRTQPVPGTLLYAERNFFGVNRLFKWNASHSILLLHGTTLHGLQSLEPEKKLKLTTYYSVIPDVYAHLDPKLRQLPFAVLGLGAGTLACVGHKGQAVDFFEIDPVMAQIAQNPKFFTYLSDCPPKSDIRLGDGRLEIAKMEDGRFGFIAVDTFSSDSIPVHILTREALAIYTSKLADGGIMAFNISNRHLHLAPLMAAMAKDAGMAALIKEDIQPAEADFVTSSEWVIMARRMEDFHGLQKDDTLWKPLEDTRGFAVWTDNYSNIFQTLF